MIPRSGAGSGSNRAVTANAAHFRIFMTEVAHRAEAIVRAHEAGLGRNA